MSASVLNVAVWKWANWRHLLNFPRDERERERVASGVRVESAGELNSE